MAMIKGIPVTLHVKTQNGVDDFKAPIYAESTVVVDNVLVGQPSTREVLDNTQLFGKKAVFTLCIPKGDTHNWEDTKVEFFGKTWRTFGFVTQSIEANVPLDWNKKVMVERYG